MPSRPNTLHLSNWRETRDTLHLYAKIIGKIRRHHMPKSKHWWHISLYVSARGLTTTPFPIGGQHLELLLDLINHQLRIDSSEGWSTSLPLVGQSATEICHRITTALTDRDITLEPGIFADFQSEEPLIYDTQESDRYRQVINWVDAVFKRFKGGLREESGPVQIYPHHMDLSLNWFSGRLVPGIDPADEESADEQMNFGFVTGDASIPDAYFYITAYPTPGQWTDLKLGDGAYWHTEGWTGAILPYEVIATSEKSYERLLGFMQQLHVHGKRLMT
ncbi:MAG: hypothetical protein KZQ93_11430 [Candidatus Thiodiazotropha sp. (ex Monitilora ramsayi)]|nr:hypothetical protein [Candidatus Thiodiazotropha sp. (ex Monitilora ramsayi)]